MFLYFQGGDQRRPTLSRVLPKMGYWDTATLLCSISICLPNLMQTYLLATEIWPKTRSNMAADLNSYKCYFGPPVSVVWPIWCSAPNLLQIAQELAEMHLFVHFQDGGRPPYWISYSRAIKCTASHSAYNTVIWSPLNTQDRLQNVIATQSSQSTNYRRIYSPFKIKYGWL